MLNSETFDLVLLLPALIFFCTIITKYFSGTHVSRHLDNGNELFSNSFRKNVSDLSIENCILFSKDDIYPRIMVTGGAGFIGSNLIKELKNSGFKSVKVIDNFWRGKIENLKDEEGNYVVDIDRDVCHGNLTNREISFSMLKNVDRLIHLADVVAGISFVFDNQGWLFEQNLLINTNVFSAAQRWGIEQIVYPGTACSYPASVQSTGTLTNPTVLDESQVYPAEPESAYGWSKLIGEYHLSLLSLKASITVLRLHNVYGPNGEYDDPLKAQAIPAVIRKGINFPKEEYIIWGDGKQYRDFIYIDDVVSGFKKVIDQFKPNAPYEVIQLGTGVPTSLAQIGGMVKSITEICLKKELVLSFNHSKRNGDEGRIADITKAKLKLGWKANITIKLGVLRSYLYILKDMNKKKLLPNLIDYKEAFGCLTHLIREEEMKGETVTTKFHSKTHLMRLNAEHKPVQEFLPHIFCPNERQNILEELKKSPGLSVFNKTLVVVISTVRSHHLTWNQFEHNILEPLGADLALAIEESPLGERSRFHTAAKYVWEIGRPKHNDFMYYYNDIAEACFNHTFDEHYANVMGDFNGKESGWLGCIKAANQKACSANIIFFRWFALQNIMNMKLYLEYTHVVVTRSDFLWTGYHPNPVDLINNNLLGSWDQIWVPQCSDWGGLSDRHYVLTMIGAVKTLGGLAESVVERENPNAQVAWLRETGFNEFGNLEAANYWWHITYNRMTLHRFTLTGLLVKDDAEHAKYNWESETFMYPVMVPTIYHVRYMDEYMELLKLQWKSPYKGPLEGRVVLFPEVGKTVYLIENNLRHALSLDSFVARGFDFEEVLHLPEGEIYKIPDGEAY